VVVVVVMVVVVVVAIMRIIRFHFMPLLHVNLIITEFIS